MSTVTDKNAAGTGTAEADKGKSKVVDNVVETTDDDSSDDDMGDVTIEHEADLDEEDDDLAGIDTSNIIRGGRRTRGKQIDFAKAAREDTAMDEDEDEDEDFQEKTEGK